MAKVARLYGKAVARLNQGVRVRWLESRGAEFIPTATRGNRSSCYGPRVTISNLRMTSGPRDAASVSAWATAGDWPMEPTRQRNAGATSCGWRTGSSWQ
jgi:hypothetical protein